VKKSTRIIFCWGVCCVLWCSCCAIFSGPCSFAIKRLSVLNACLRVPQVLLFRTRDLRGVPCRDGVRRRRRLDSKAPDVEQGFLAHPLDKH
jgi:hypothetical protein